MSENKTQQQKDCESSFERLKKSINGVNKNDVNSQIEWLKNLFNMGKEYK